MQRFVFSLKQFSLNTVNSTTTLFGTKVCFATKDLAEFILANRGIHYRKVLCDLMSLPLWEECAWEKSTDGSAPTNAFEAPLDILSAPVAVFEPKRSINRRIYLHCGEAFKLPCDAIIVGQTELLNDVEDQNYAILSLGGPELESSLQAVAPLNTGESTIVSGGFLSSPWLIAAVGPKYDTRYLSACDQTLYAAYNSALTKAASQPDIQRIVISCVYSRANKYPRFDAAHVALRTVRKFLDHSIGDQFQHIMFSVPTQDDYEIYSALMTAYFPRNSMEVEGQQTMLPADLGDEWGQFIIADRVLKVSAGPKPLPRSSSIDDNGGIGSERDSMDGRGSYQRRGEGKVEAPGPKPRGMMADVEDADELRKQKVAKDFQRMSKDDRLKLKFQLLLDDAVEEDLDDMEKLNFLDFIGKDRLGRTVVFITAAHLLVDKVDRDRVLLYFMRRMEELRCLPYVIVYAYSGVTFDNSPDSAFVQAIFDLFTARYKENLQQLYILHASFSFRMYMRIALPMLTTPFWSTYKFVDSLKDLNIFVEMASVTLPEIVSQHDTEKRQK